MEKQFESRFVRDTALAKEIYQYLFFKKPLNMVLDILMVLVFVVNLTVSILTQVWNNGLFLFVIPAFFGYQIYLYRKAVKTMVEQEKEINNGAHISVVITADEEGFTQTTSTGTESVLKYGDIKKVMLTKHLLLIQSYENLLYTIRKDAFTQGTAEEFLTLLKEKGK